MERRIAWCRNRHGISPQTLPPSAPTQSPCTHTHAPGLTHLIGIVRWDGIEVCISAGLTAAHCLSHCGTRGACELNCMRRDNVTAWWVVRPVAVLKCSPKHRAPVLKISRRASHIKKCGELFAGDAGQDEAMLHHFCSSGPHTLHLHGLVQTHHKKAPRIWVQHDPERAHRLGSPRIAINLETILGYRHVSSWSAWSN